MAIIKILDKHTAELIAAGEVVERPASVVKELLENTIDAGATQVTVSIENGGVRFIEVSDNGTGIEREYIHNAFIRHATSKISSKDDLDSIATLGFRGEALASIASVARVEVLTKTEDEEFACLYKIEGSNEKPPEVAARATGTTIRVRDLFFNTPARMKFLKKDSSEGTFVADLVGHVALSHPEVSFKFIREGKLQYVTAGDGNLQATAYSVLGREFARELVNVESTNGFYRVHGLVSPPSKCRASRSMQYFYINGRYVKNRTMMAALETAYKGTLMHGKFPGCVLTLEMPTDLIDVNVHPAKTEVRFAREKDVFDAVYQAVKASLMQIGTKDHKFTISPSKIDDSSFLNNSAQKNVDLPQNFQGEKQNNFTHSSAFETVKTADVNTKSTEYFSENQLNISSNAIDDISCGSKTENLHHDKHEIVIGANEPILSGRLYSSAFEKEQEKVSAKWNLQHDEELLRSFDSVKKHDYALDILPNVDEVSAMQRFISKGVKTVCEPIKVENKPQTNEVEINSQQKQAAFENISQPNQSKAQNTFETPIVSEQISLLKDEAEPLKFIGELFKTYILAQKGEELCFIDKHAAHERMIYENLIANYGNVSAQMLMESVVVNLSASEKNALLDNVDLLENSGIEVDDFGGTSILVRAVPCDVEVRDVQSLIVELASKLATGEKNAINERTESVLHSVSCRAAMKAGDKTNTQSLLNLAQKIMSGEIPPFCPHGRPCILRLTRKDIEKQFGRII